MQREAVLQQTNTSVDTFDTFALPLPDKLMQDDATFASPPQPILAYNHCIGILQSHPKLPISFDI